MSQDPQVSLISESVIVDREYRVTGATPMPPYPGARQLFVPEVAWVQFKDGRFRSASLGGPRLTKAGTPAPIATGSAYLSRSDRERMPPWLLALAVDDPEVSP